MQVAGELLRSNGPLGVNLGWYHWGLLRCTVQCVIVSRPGWGWSIQYWRILRHPISSCNSATAKESRLAAKLSQCSVVLSTPSTCTCNSSERIFSVAGRTQDQRINWTLKYGLLFLHGLNKWIDFNSWVQTCLGYQHRRNFLNSLTFVCHVCSSACVLYR